MMAWLWTLAASIGTLAAIWNTYDAWLDLRALGEIRNGRRLIAAGWVRRELIRVLIQVSWAVIGFMALPNAATSQVTFFAVLLVSTNVAVAVNTVLDARDRIALRRLVGGR